MAEQLLKDKLGTRFRVLQMKDFRQATKLILFSTSIILASNNQFTFLGTGINYILILQHKYIYEFGTNTIS